MNVTALVHVQTSAEVTLDYLLHTRAQGRPIYGRGGLYIMATQNKDIVKERQDRELRDVLEVAVPWSAGGGKRSGLAK